MKEKKNVVDANVVAAPASALPAAPPAVAAPKSAPQAPAAAAAAPAPFPATEAEEARRDQPAARSEAAAGALAKERVAMPDATAAPRVKAEGKAVASQAASAAEPPEKKLEKIAELRRAGRDREADEALEKFRREHPDFKIPPETWERVRPR